MLLGIDAGNDRVKVCGPLGAIDFCSEIGEYRERNLVNVFGPEEMEWEYLGKKGFAGTLAKYESEFTESMKGLTKANDDAKLRILLSIHRYSNGNEFKIVVGQPIKKYNDTEKRKIKNMMIGDHTLTVNRETKSFTISRCEVTAEGAGVGLLQPRPGTTRIIDIGSGTVNFGSVRDMRFIDKDSFTEDFGLNTITNKDYAAMARRIGVRALNKWDRDDYVRLVGGGAAILHDPLKEFFPNVEIFSPVSMLKTLDPVHANACVFFEIARKIYG